MDKIFQCPECTNQYSTKFQYCPECEITLIDQSKTNHQILSGHDHVAIQGSHNYTQVTKIEQHGYHNEAVNYQVDVVHTYANRLSFYKKPIIFGGLLFIDLISLFMDISSIANNLGFTIDNFPVKTWAIVIATILTIFYNQSLKTIKVLKNKTGLCVHQNPDGQIYLLKVKAKCPIQGCSGIIYPVHPQEFNQLTEVMGLCSNHPNRHVFEFNADTAEGVRVEPNSI